MLNGVRAQAFFFRNVFAADIRYRPQLLNGDSHQLFPACRELSKYWTSEYVNKRLSTIYIPRYCMCCNKGV